ncbi:MAG: hypothetical protein QM762_07040 [Chryseolinea sp.]
MKRRSERSNASSNASPPNAASPRSSSPASGPRAACRRPNCCSSNTLRDGKSTLPPKNFVVEGRMIHVDSLVVKFDRGFVKDDDALRGRSSALFQRIYGDQQKPADAPRIDDPGRIPAFYRGSGPAVSEFESQLWENFWKLASDESYRKERGVRVAQGEAVYLPFELGRLYTISLESSGGLNLLSEPVKGIYREALKQQKPTP